MRTLSLRQGAVNIPYGSARFLAGVLGKGIKATWEVVAMTQMAQAYSEIIV